MHTHEGSRAAASILGSRYISKLKSQKPGLPKLGLTNTAYLTAYYKTPTPTYYKL